MKFYGKSKPYRPVTATVRLGSSGYFDVYSAEPKDADQPPFALYYSYQIVNGSPVLYIEPSAREPIVIPMNNAMLDSSVYTTASATGANCELCPSRVNVSLRVLGVGRQ